MPSTTFKLHNFMRVYGCFMLALTVSCTRENLPAEIMPERTALEFISSVSFADAQQKTRIVGSTNIHWVKGDSISVCEQIASENQRGAAFIAQNDGESAVFKGMAPELDAYYALYPASAVKNWKADGSASVYTKLPANQKAVSGNVDPAALLMCAKTGSDKMQLAFKTIVSLIKFTIDSSSPQIVSICINAPGQYLVGSSAVNTSYSSPVLAGTGAKTSVAVLEKEDRSVFEPGDYYLAVLPRTYSSLEFTFTNSSGLVSTKSLTDVKFEAGVVYSTGKIPDLFEAPKVQKYNYSPSLSSSEKYQVCVEGVEQFVYPSTTLEGYDEQLHVCAFGCKEGVSVTVRPCSGTVSSATVRPTSIDYSSSFADNTLTLMLKPCDRAIVEFDGDYAHPLMLFANELENRPESATYYFKAGEVYNHDQIRLQSGESIYVEGGAVVHTTVRSSNAGNISVKGAGIIDASEISAYSVHINKFTDAVFDGICTIGRDAAIYWLASGTGLTLHNTKGLALFSRRNSSGNENDALDLVSVNDVNVTKGFSYTHDDCCVVKSGVTTGGVSYTGTSKNILVDDFVSAYRDSGHGFGIGYSCFEDVSDVTFRNIYVPYGYPPRVSYSKSGQLAVHNTGSGKVSLVTFENAHLEQASNTQAFFISIFEYADHDYGQAGYVPGYIEGVKFKNIYLDAAPQYGNYIIGYDASAHRIPAVSFENLYFGGQKILSRTDARITDGEMGGYNRVRFKFADEPEFQ